jgi:hypothetical protein
VVDEIERGGGYRHIYLATDEADHPIVQTILATYPSDRITLLHNATPVQTIQFGSTCRHLVLSHGSFSAVIGYLAFDPATEVYYSRQFDRGQVWHGDLFSIPSWHEV